MSFSFVQAGTVLGGDFQILRPLASGGMGSVFVARQLSTTRDRALKLVHPELLSNEDIRRRFEQEAKVSAQIESDHVVEVVAAGIDGPTGSPYIAMELLVGRDFGSYLEENGARPAAEVLDIFEQVGHAMGAAHDKQIVHRDLKPENLFLAQTRSARSSFVVKVLDFGIAKLLDHSRTTRTGAMGTPLWMAPEQTEPNRRVTAAADVWALGLIVFRALVGRCFWKSAAVQDASSVAVLREVVFEPLPSASDRARDLGAGPLPRGFDEWFARSVARDPGQRFQHAREQLIALRGVLAASASGPPLDLRTSAAPASPIVVEPRDRTSVGAPIDAALAPMPLVSPSTGGPVAHSVLGAKPPPRRRGWLFAGGAAALGLAGAAVVWATHGESPKKHVEEQVSSAEAEPERASAAASSAAPAMTPPDTHVSASPEPSATATSTASADTAPTAVAVVPSPTVTGKPTGAPTATGIGTATTTPTTASAAPRPASEVRNGLAPARPRARACYNAGLTRFPDLKGTVKVTLTIQPNGSVSAASASGSLPDPQVQSCVAAAHKTLKFAPCDCAPTTVSVPYTFNSQ